ncbi:MAG: Ig-like domain-containing protein [Lacticaseibacillus paracasei]
MSQKTLTGAVGSTKDITVTVTPDGAPQEVKAVSSNEKVATVVKKSDGVYTITNLTAGTATITFSTNGISSTLAVTVNAG